VPVPLEWKNRHGIGQRTDRQVTGKYEKPEDLIEQNGLPKQLTKALVELAFRCRIDEPPDTKGTTLKAVVAATLETERAKRG
jgi:hypothetical protein